MPGCYGMRIACEYVSMARKLLGLERIGLSGLRGKVLSLLVVCALSCSAQVSVLTANGSNDRTSANLQETQLTPSSVTPGRFGKLGTFSVDGQVFSQALYVSGLVRPDGSTKNVLYVTTMHNSVYAFDADSAASPTVLWQESLGFSVPAMQVYGGYGDIAVEIGILSTGVIDAASGVLYVVAETLQGSAPVFYLHALDLVSGAERMNGPVAITGASGTVQFDPQQHIQRPGLLLANGAIYIGFGSHGDQSPWHGWLMSYDASDLRRQFGAFNTTPRGDGAAIWQSGRGPAADDQGNVFVITGNGDFDSLQNFGQSFVKLSGVAPAVAASYTPADWQSMDDDDVDLSAGPALVTGTNTIIGADKDGTLYVLNRDTLQPYSTASGAGYPVSGGMIFNLAVWSRANGAYIYVQGEGEGLKCFQLTGTSFSATPISTSAATVQYGRIGMTISANGSQDGTGILWETTGNYNDDTQPGVLDAFDASNLANELWNSQMYADRDGLGAVAKFLNPTVANGNVYVPTFSSTVAVYGMLPPADISLPPAITTTANAASFAQNVISPGALVSVFGSNLGSANPGGTQLDANGIVTTSLADTVVLFDGVPGPLMYTSATQVNAIAPFELAGGASTQVQVVYRGQASAPYTIAVAESSPGIFSLDGSGGGQGLIFNQDGTINSPGNPAAADSVIFFYATGAGQLSPPGQDGAVVTGGSPQVPVLPVSAGIGGQTALVLYAGGAAGIVEGVIQVNLQIPSGTVAGTAVPLVLGIGDGSSQTNLTVAVQDAGSLPQAQASQHKTRTPNE